MEWICILDFDYTPDGASEPVRVTVDDVLTLEDIGSEERAQALVDAGVLAPR